MTFSKVLRSAVLLAGAAGLIVVLDRLKPPSQASIWGSLFDAGHGPLFGVFALLALGLSLEWLRWAGSKRVLHYLLAGALAMGTGIVSEIAQVWRPRDADPWDLARDVLGTLAFLLVAASFDAQLMARFPRRKLIAMLLGFLGVALFFAAVAPAVQLGWDLARREIAFPRISDYESGWGRRFEFPNHATLSRTGRPTGWPGDRGGRVARIDFYADPTSSGFSIRGLHRDWSQYNVLAFDVFSELDRPTRIVLHLDDLEHKERRTEPMDRVLMIHPGLNEITIGLDDMRTRGGRHLDPRRICHLSLLSVRPTEPFRLYMDAFRLESRDAGG